MRVRQIYCGYIFDPYAHLQVIGTLVDIHNTTIFEKNTAMDLEASLLIESFGQIRMFPQTRLFFDRNIGRLYSLRISIARLIFMWSL